MRRQTLAWMRGGDRGLEQPFEENPLCLCHADNAPRLRRRNNPCVGQYCQVLLELSQARNPELHVDSREVQSGGGAIDAPRVALF
jgi:hypothetical protein